MFDFQGKVAVITGASGISIGKTIAKHFFEAGAKVAVCSHNEERIMLAAKEI